MVRVAVDAAAAPYRSSFPEFKCISYGRYVGMFQADSRRFVGQKWDERLSVDWQTKNPEDVAELRGKLLEAEAKIAALEAGQAAEMAKHAEGSATARQRQGRTVGEGP
ncbi:MAG TPA: hypothetical protein VE987_10105 [Polyangiaceae bacterium]|nr:hypothetical protein [Polyangiaceae bacterium]